MRIQDATSPPRAEYLRVNSDSLSSSPRPQPSPVNLLVRLFLDNVSHVSNGPEIQITTSGISTSSSAPFRLILNATINKAV